MRIAAIDVGTNSVHMIVCRIRPDFSFEVIDREKDMIRLGAGGLNGRKLPAPNVAMAMQTLAKYKRLAESHGVDEIIAAATSAVREAENGADFVAAAREKIGVRVRVISGTEEARLIHLAAAYAVGVGRRPAVVIDIGGGSVEVTLGTSARVELGKSVKLGVIRLTERFAQSDPLQGRDERRLVKHIRREAGSHLKQVIKRGFDRVIGTSGTILALGALASGDDPNADVRGRRISARAIHRLRDALTKTSLDERLKLPGLDPRRADIIVAGAVLIDTLLDGLGADEITLCDFALREGLVLDYVQKNAAHIRKVDRYPDARRRSVLELAERCHYLPDHAQQVARLALALFDGTKEEHELGAREREWLEYAALLHDIGGLISYEKHHRHSAYLVRHGGLRGFDPEEIEIIALLTRYHRQSTPSKAHREYAALEKPTRKTVRVLAALLRLAEGLDRSHAQTVASLTVSHEKKGWLVRLRAKGDAELEHWAAGRHAAALAVCFDSAIRFEVAGHPAPVMSRKDSPAHAQHAQLPSRVSRAPVRRRRH